MNIDQLLSEQSRSLRQIEKEMCCLITAINAIGIAPPGSGTVTTVSVVTANGISGSVATASSTPAITLTLGAITPTSVNGITNLVGTTDVQTLTNKRITPRVQSAASSATLNVNSDSYDMAVLTAQAAALTIANPTGTPTEGQALLYKITDNGTARAITFGAQFRAFGAALPTTTVINKTIYIGCIWNSTDTKWDVFPSNEEQ